MDKRLYLPHTQILLMSDLFSSLLGLIKMELEKPEWKEDVLVPIAKKVLITILPYALGIICLNFFLTIAAISLVLFINNRR